MLKKILLIGSLAFSMNSFAYLWVCTGSSGYQVGLYTNDLNWAGGACAACNGSGGNCSIFMAPGGNIGAEKDQALSSNSEEISKLEEILSRFSKKDLYDDHTESIPGEFKNSNSFLETAVGSTVEKNETLDVKNEGRE
jgi:hypothetical protein